MLSRAAGQEDRFRAEPMEGIRKTATELSIANAQKAAAEERRQGRTEARVSETTLGMGTLKERCLDLLPDREARCFLTTPCDRIRVMSVVRSCLGPQRRVFALRHETQERLPSDG
jgi:hypothetical protein